MAKAVFTTKVDPSYDDLPEERYHFPRTYLRQAESAIGDWIVYYEPRRGSSDLLGRGGRQAYFATAMLERIERDPQRDDRFYAQVSNFLPFERAVPFKDGAFYFEAGLRRGDGETNKGAFGRSVRPLSDPEYELILKAGFAQTLGETEVQSAPTHVPAFGFAEEDQAVFERPIIERIVARPFREAAFAVAVKSAYGDTCAITGLRIINGGGRAEVQAAHIRPVAAGGTDSVRNGLALSGTVHWMFDRGLVSVDEDYSILIAEDRIPSAVMQLVRADRKLFLPDRSDLRPHSTQLRFHRETVFKG